MTRERILDKENLSQNEDWAGNNAAFLCPHCSKVFVVSGHQHRQGRRCPRCEGSKGYVSIKGDEARFEW